MATIAKSPKAPSGGASSPPFNYGDLKKSLEYLSSLFSSPQGQMVKKLLDELSKQQEQLNAAKAQAEEHNIAVRQMSLTLQQEATKTNDAEEKIKSAYHALEEKKKIILEGSQRCNDLDTQNKRLQSGKSKLEGKVAQASRDITSLQEKLKEKDSIIDKAKTAESELNKALSFEKQKNKDLQTLHAGTQDQLRNIQSRLNELEGFGVRHQEMDEQTMLASTHFKPRKIKANKSIAGWMASSVCGNMPQLRFLQSYARIWRPRP